MSATYKIGEAATQLNLKTYVLRFWETEFPQIAPLRTEKGQRLYTSEHLALIKRIRFLLHERGLTIDGARKILQEDAAAGLIYTWNDEPSTPSPSETFTKSKSDLLFSNSVGCPPAESSLATDSSSDAVCLAPASSMASPAETVENIHKEHALFYQTLCAELEAVVSLLRTPSTPE